MAIESMFKDFCVCGMWIAMLQKPMERTNKRNRYRVDGGKANEEALKTYLDFGTYSCLTKIVFH